MKMQDNKKFKILIVDDMPKNIQLLGSILREEGYDIAFAKSGIEALERIKSSDFDLFLLDIMMPEMDGFEVCNHLKNNFSTRDIPIIFLSAKNDIESIVKGFNIGAVDYISKPFNATELLARVRTHLALKYQAEKLTEINNAKDKFFSIIAHDLRTPLLSFHGLTKMLHEDYNNFSEEERLEFVSKMHLSAEQLFGLLENLLEWSRIQTNKIPFNPSEFDLYKVVLENILLLKNNADCKKITIINTAKENTSVIADKYMIQTVIRNLISNAIKFTKNNGEIKISTHKNNSTITVSIEDNGIGIAVEDIPKLFKIDEHFSNTGTNNEKGSGIGLILCKEFIEKNNGKIWVESKKNKGSTFFFTLNTVQ